MLAMVIDNYGDPDVFRLAEVPTLPLGPQDVAIDIYATSVNPIDWKMRQGLLKAQRPLSFPAILGWDAAGRIAAVGSQVTRFKVGDPVFTRPAIDRPGTYAQKVIVAESLVAPKPPTLTYLEAASVPLAGLTAWQALVDIAQVRPQQRVLIHGGAGGVGGYAIQLAKALGAEVITTARAERHPYVRSLGADQVIDYQQQPFETAVDSVDVVLDTIGGTVQDRSFQVLKPGGVLVSIVRPPDAETAARYQVRGEWFFLEPDGEKLAKLGAFFTDGRIRPIVQQVFPLQDLPAAHRLSESGQTQGKIGIVVDPTLAETR